MSCGTVMVNGVWPLSLDEQCLVPLSNVGFGLIVCVRPSPLPERSGRSWSSEVAEPVPVLVKESPVDPSASCQSGSCCGPPSPPAASVSVGVMVSDTWDVGSLSVAVTGSGTNLWFGGQSLSGPLSATVSPLPQSREAVTAAYLLPPAKLGTAMTRTVAPRDAACCALAAGSSARKYGIQ